MNNGRLAVFGLAAALGIGTTAAVLEYQSGASAGSIVELTGDDLQAKPREAGEDDLLVADDSGAGDDPNDTTKGGVGTGGATTGGAAGDTTNHTTRGGRGTGDKTTGGQRGDTAQTTVGGRGTGGATTGGAAGDTTQSASGGGGGGVFLGGGGSFSGGGGSGSGGGT